MTHDGRDGGTWRPPARERLVAFGARRVRLAPRDILRWLLVGLLVLVPSAAWGVATASAEAALGPHVARYEVTVDHEVTVDLGPLGTLVIDSPLPLGLGARVVVKEIPREVTALQGVDTVEALEADLERYVQFFSSPSATLEDAVRALVADALQRTALAAALIVVVVWGGRALVGEARRREISAAVVPHRTAVAGGAVLVLVVTSTMTASDDRVTTSPDVQTASAVFDGTPLEGARITGRLAGVIDTYGGYVVDAYRDNEEFYADAEDNLVEAWAEREAADSALALLEGSGTQEPQPDGLGEPAPTGAPMDGTTASPTTAPEDDQGTYEATGRGDGGPVDEGMPEGVSDPALPDVRPDDGDPADADPDGAATEEEGRDGVDQDDEAELEVAQVAGTVEPVTMVLVSDLHCNVGMAPLIGTAVRLAEAGLLLDAGDTTVNGTGVESYCVTAFSGAVPDGVDIVVAGGNHDSPGTLAQYAATGAHVLDGTAVELRGLRILGDTDPKATRIGVGTTLVGDEDPVEAGARLAETACQDPAGIDVLLVHDPAMGEATLGEGCAPAQLSGHFHRRIGPERVAEGVRYVSSSTAGAALGRPTLGPLSGVAEMTVLRFDPESRQMIDYRVVRVHPTAAVEVGAAVPWPAGSRWPEPPPVPAGSPEAGVGSIQEDVVR